MARPRLALGTAGRISVVGQVQSAQGRWVAVQTGQRPQRYRARCLVRDVDGVSREVARFSSTKSRAEKLLKEALVVRSAPAQVGEMQPEMEVVDAGRFWLRRALRADSGLSSNTQAQYASSFERYIEGSSIAHLTLREVNRVHILEGFLQGVADQRGNGSAKTARSVLSNILGLAVRFEVLPYNAMRDVRPAKASRQRTVGRGLGEERDTQRALTRFERAHLLAVAAQHSAAQRLDVADIVWWLAGTGVRISEALAQQWDDVDLAAGRVLVRGTKSASSERTLVLPEWLAEKMRARASAAGREGYVFPSPTSAAQTKPRDRRNVARVFRAVLDEAGYPWATPHTLRRTVATLLDEAGLPLVMAANQLGHANPAMTARVYLGRRGDMSAAASAL